MKILILTHSYPDKEQPWRGAFVREQAEALAGRNDVTVVFFRVDYSSFSPFGKYSFEKTEKGRLAEYRVTVRRSLPVINQLKYFSDTYRFIRRELFSSGSRPDLIHAHLSYPAGILAIIIRHFEKIPVVLTEHTWIKKYFRSAIHKTCVRIALRKADAVVAVSDALRKDIGRHVTRSVDVVPNVIDETRFPLCKRSPGQVLNMGLLGGMSNYRKGLDILIKAATLVSNRNIVFHIGGDGTLLPEFKAMALELGVHDRFVFHGGILQPDLIAFYSTLDAYILASRDETFGVVIIEAMSCGIPVIATRCGGPEEIVTPETGLLVASESPEQLALAIGEMANNITRFSRADISRYAAESYGRKAFTRKIDSLYCRLLPEGA